MSWRKVREFLSELADEDDLEAALDERFGVHAAVVVTDINAFSKRTREFGIGHMLRLFAELEDVASPFVTENNGRIYKQVGDDLFIRFSQGVDAVRCMTALHRALDVRNRSLPARDHIKLAVGVAEGRFLDIEDDLWGGSLNEASKLGEDLASGSELLITQTCYSGLPDDWKLRFAREEVEISRVDLVYYRYLAVEGLESFHAQPASSH